MFFSAVILEEFFHISESEIQHSHQRSSPQHTMDRTSSIHNLIQSNHLILIKMFKFVSVFIVVMTVVTAFHKSSSPVRASLKMSAADLPGQYYYVHNIILSNYM